MKMIDKPSVIVVMKPEDLRPHPKNDYYFPAVGDEEDDQFVASVRERGIINMPVITTDGVIISGHRRVKAAILCGFDQIQCQRREYENEDMVLYDLLASNIMSRGGVGGLFAQSPIKGSRVIQEFSRLFGNDKNYRKTEETPIGISMTMPEMASELGISRSAIGRAKQIANIEESLTEELEGKLTAQKLVEVGKLNPFQQKLLIEKLLPDNYGSMSMAEFTSYVNALKDKCDDYEGMQEDVTFLEEKLERYVQKAARLEEMQNPNCNLDDEIKQRQEYEVQCKKMKAQIADLRVKLTSAQKELADTNELHNEIQRLHEALDEQENATPETVEVYVEVAPDDYDDLKAKVEELSEDNENLRKEIAELREMDNLASFAMANIRTMQDMAGNIESEELTEQLKIIENEMNKLITRVAELKRAA